MIDIDEASKATVVRDIETFLGSLAGKYYAKHFQQLQADRIDYLLDQSINSEYTVLTREGFIGEIRQLREDSNLLQNLKTQLVEEIKESQLNKETNGPR